MKTLLVAMGTISEFYLNSVELSFSMCTLWNKYLN